MEINLGRKSDEKTSGRRDGMTLDIQGGLWTFEKVQLLNENFPGTFLGFETDSHSKYFCPREL